MPDAQASDVMAASQLVEKGEKRPGLELGRGDRHQTGERHRRGAHGVDEAGQVGQRHPTLLLLGAEIDLDESGRTGRARRQARSTARAGRASGWYRTSPPPRPPCSIAAGRSCAGGRRDSVLCSAGHLSCASCTRLSPKSRWPASISASISSAVRRFDTATSVTSSGSRRAFARRGRFRRGHWKGGWRHRSWLAL